MMQLTLSLFTGAGLFDKAFREEGFCVVSAGDIIYGQDIREFKGVPNRFDGLIAGTPCQDFSGLKREKTDYSMKMVNEFIRVVNETQPRWWLLENVVGVPDVQIDGYNWQRLDINQGWYDNTSRLRNIQFGSKEGLHLDIPRGEMKEIYSKCALASDDRSFKELCTIQGLDEDFNLPDFTVAGKKKMVGNGVPLSIGRVLAKEVARVTGRTEKYVTSPGDKSVIDRHRSPVTDRDNKGVMQQHSICVTDQDVKRCPCGCKRPLTGRKTYYDASCRQRAFRRRKRRAS